MYAVDSWVSIHDSQFIFNVRWLFFPISFFVVFGICFFFFACKFHDWMIQEQVFFVLLSSMMLVHVQNRFASSSTHIIVVNFCTSPIAFPFHWVQQSFFVVCGHHRGFFPPFLWNFFFLQLAHSLTSQRRKSAMQTTTIIPAAAAAATVEKWEIHDHHSFLFFDEGDKNLVTFNSMPLGNGLCLCFWHYSFR